jgi:hypothetical protein
LLLGPAKIEATIARAPEQLTIYKRWRTGYRAT